MTAFRQKRKKKHFFPAVLTLLLLLPAAGFSGTPLRKDVARDAEQQVDTSIRIRQETQKDLTKWEAEKSALVLEYEALLAQKQALETEHRALAARRSSQEAVTNSLIAQKKESIRVANELAPFLNTVHERLKSLVAADTPFLKKERAGRLAKLDKIMKDPEVTVAEKYRKVMETLFIEAEYGATIEVYQDKILMASIGGEATLGNIFRLGRVSLFFLSLDQTVCGVFDPGSGKWQALPESMLPPIRSAVEIGGKRRPVELLSLPIGRLAAGEDTP